jgi:CheY-like chemotaxis protein
MKRKILFVDDEQDLRLMFRMGLEHEGLHVDMFRNSAEVLKNFKPCFYDLAILDIAMPDMDGIELYRELKKIDPNIKVCFLTATQKHREDPRGGEYQDLSLDLFIEKPISIKDLAREVYERTRTNKIDN